MKIRLSVFNVEQNQWVIRKRLSLDGMIESLKSLDQLYTKYWEMDLSESYELKYHLLDENRVCRDVVIIQSDSHHNTTFEEIEEMIQKYYIVKKAFYHY
jgi:hypothetical protein